MMEHLRSATHIDPPLLVLLLVWWWLAWLFIAYVGNKWIDWRYGIRRK